MSEPGYDIMSRAMGTTRYETGILSTATEDSLNQKRSHSTPSKKRKRTSESSGDNWDSPFSVRRNPSSMYERPRTMTPICVMSRLYLPLSYIDAGSLGLPSSRHYSAHIKALDLPPPDHARSLGPSTLIAKLEPTKALYAIERVESGLYAICALGNWVNASKLRAVAWLSTPDTQHIALENEMSDQDVDNDLPAHSPNNVSAEARDKRQLKKLRRVESIQSLLRKPTSVSAIPTPPPSDLADIPVDCSTNLPTHHPVPDLPEVLPTPDEVLEMIRRSYIEALYLSNTSLAYFAKGPLSRARSAFTGDPKSPLATSLLAEFLETRVLPLALFGKKYRETIPELVQDVPVYGSSGEETPDGKTVGSKKRKLKKPKLGRDGLLPEEKNYILKWWKKGSDDEVPTDPRENAKRRRIASLQARETQLQMILVLEILWLRNHVEIAQEETGPPGATKEDTTAVKRKNGPGKKQDLLVTLDMHADRLCIWQSVDNEQQSLDVSKPAGTQQGPGSSSPAKGMSNDRLRNFCVEVIIPFFSARLKDICKALNRKLGGPTLATSTRPLQRSASTSQVTSRAGDAAKRQLPPPPRTLQRVLTDEKRSQSNDRPSTAPGLSRSMTAPAGSFEDSLPSLKHQRSRSFIKREGSETPLTSIPTVSRPGILNTKRFSQREVDLSIPKARVDKLMQKKKVDEELKTAISTLKRPNRGLAVKDLVDNAERRTLASGPGSRKAKKPVRNPFAPGVQVMATPRGNRNMDALPPMRVPFGASLQAYEPGIIPPSSPARIPSSTSKAAFILKSSPPIPASKRPAAQKRLFECFDTPTKQPLGNALGNSLKSAVPDSAGSRVPETGKRVVELSIEDTPTKKRPRLMSVKTAPAAMPSTLATDLVGKSTSIVEEEDGKEGDIYAALGWDDEVDAL